MNAQGTLHSDGEAITAEIATLEATAGPLTLSGTSAIRLQQELLSSPSLALAISHRDAEGVLKLQGTVADVMAFRGIALDFDADAVDLESWAALSGRGDDMGAPVRRSRRGHTHRVGDRLRGNGQRTS